MERDGFISYYNSVKKSSIFKYPKKEYECFSPKLYKINKGRFKNYSIHRNNCATFVSYSFRKAMLKKAKKVKNDIRPSGVFKKLKKMKKKYNI